MASLTRKIEKNSCHVVFTAICFHLVALIVVVSLKAEEEEELLCVFGGGCISPGDVGWGELAHMWLLVAVVLSLGGGGGYS